MKRSFCLDLRSLSLMRIGISLVVLWDLVDHALNLEPFLTDAGIITRETLARHGPAWLLWPKISFFLWSGAKGWSGLGLFLAALSMVALLLGYRTRMAAIVGWYMVNSLMARTPSILFGGDTIIRIVLFWGMFLPWGERFSIERSKNTGDGSSIFCVAGVGFTIQIVCIYVVSALSKFGGHWLETSDAVKYALSTDLFSGSVGYTLVRMGVLGPWATQLVLILEYGAVLILLPMLWGIPRAIAVSGLIVLHLGIALLMDIALFPWACIAMLTGLLPSVVWREVRHATPIRFHEEWGTQIILGALILAVVVTNVINGVSYAGRGLGGRAGQLEGALSTLGLPQGWNFFAPEPPLRGDWFIARGELSDDREMDLFTEQLPRWKKKKALEKTQPVRWRQAVRFFDVGGLPSDDLGAFLCRRWNTRHREADHVKEVQLFKISNDILPDFSHAPPIRQLLAVHSCHLPSQSLIAKTQD